MWEVWLDTLFMLLKGIGYIAGIILMIGIGYWAGTYVLDRIGNKD